MANVDVRLGELEYKSLGDRAAEHIRNKIIRREYPGGMKLPEESFASGLGVSRACVREAFMILEAEGLVRRVRNRYTEVVSFTDKDIQEILDLRRAIECLSVETCLKNRNCPLADLEEQVNKIGTLSKQDGEDIEKIMEADLEFHEILVRASDNTRLINAWVRIKSQMKVLLFSALENKENVARFRGEEVHKTIITAMAERDLAKAEEEIRKHIERSAMSSLRA